MALLTVLLAVFLVALVAAELARGGYAALRRVETAAHLRQARLYALGAEAWAVGVLDRDAEPRDHLGEAWARLPPGLPVEGGTLSARLENLDGRFDLNALLGPGGELDLAQAALFAHLLAGVGLAPEVAQTVADWIDPDREPRYPGGAETAEYALLAPSYAAADRPFAALSELRAVRGITPEAYARLAPLLAALPERVPLNVNTAPGGVLAALAGRPADPALALAFATARPNEGYKTVQEFQAQSGAQTTVPLGLSGRFFRLHAEARIGTTRARLTSTLARGTDRRAHVIARQYEDEPW